MSLYSYEFLFLDGMVQQVGLLALRPIIMFYKYPNIHNVLVTLQYGS